MKVLVLVTFVCLSACSWFGSRKMASPDPTQIIVTGAPTGSIVFVDGLQAGQAAALNDRPQILGVAPGSHKVEIHIGDAVILSAGTDGEDGPTDAAGAFGDRETLVKSHRWNRQDYLNRHDAYTFFDATGDLLRTGLTGTNVMDVRVMIGG